MKINKGKAQEGINEFLQKGLKAHLELKKAGRKELATQVLRTTSVVAEQYLITHDR